MALPDEVKKAGLEAAKKLKDMMGAERLPPTDETSAEMYTGSPRAQGYDAHTGKTMKKAAEYDFEPQRPTVQSSDTPDNSAATPEARTEQPQATSSSAFEEALAEMLKEKTPASHEESHDIDP